MSRQNCRRSWILLRIAADGEYAPVVCCLSAVDAGRTVSWRFMVVRMLAGACPGGGGGVSWAAADVGGLPGSRLMRESRVLPAASLATDGERGGWRWRRAVGCGIAAPVSAFAAG